MLNLREDEMVRGAPGSVHCLSRGDDISLLMSGSWERQWGEADRVEARFSGSKSE